MDESGEKKMSSIFTKNAYLTWKIRKNSLIATKIPFSNKRNSNFFEKCQRIQMKLDWPRNDWVTKFRSNNLYANKSDGVANDIIIIIFFYLKCVSEKRRAKKNTSTESVTFERSRLCFSSLYALKSWVAFDCFCDSGICALFFF